MAVCAWHEPSPSCRGRWAGSHRRSGLVGSCSPLPQKFYSSEGAAAGRQSAWRSCSNGRRRFS